MDIKKQIGRRINEALAMRAMKQKDLAKILNVTDNTISYFCSGSRTPSVFQITEIAKALNVSSDFLLGISNICSIDPDMQSSIKYTGLSQETISFLHCINNIDSEIDELDLIQTENLILLQKECSEANNCKLLKFELLKLIEDLISIIVEEPLFFGPSYQNARWGIINNHITNKLRSNYEPKQEIVDEFNSHGLHIIASNRYAEWQLNALFDKLKHKARINIFKHAKMNYSQE